VVNQSQIDQLLNLYEHDGSGESSQANDIAKSGAETETEKLESHSGVVTNGPCTDITGVCTKEEDELFELCQEIQNIVSETDANSMIDEGSSIEKVFVSVEDEKCYNNNIATENSETDILSTMVEPNNDITELNMVDYNDEDTNCVSLPDDLLEIPQNCLPLGDDELLDCIELDKDINKCSKSSLEYTDLFESADVFKDFESILDSHTNRLNQQQQQLSSSSSSLNGDPVDVGDEWGDLLTDLFPTLSSL